VSRLAAATAAAIAFVGLEARGADASLFFLFDPTAVRPGQRATIRTGGTPANFRLRDRRSPFQQAMRLFLVRNEVAEQVRSGADRRLTPIGSLIPDKNGHGVLTFRVPNVKSGSYAGAAWCPGCARFSFGRTFFTFPVTDDIVPRYRRLMLLRVQ
jgi:hypothetical protein